MYTRRNNKYRSLKSTTLLLLAVTLASFPVDGRERFTSVSAGGLEINIIRDRTISFVHAELTIFYHEKKINPAIPHLTMLNMFDPDVNRWGSGLLSSLRKLGFDYEVENRPDYMVLKINFLREKMSTFALFLKSLYSYKSFTLKKFNYSIDQYWKLFLAQKDWHEKAAYHVAYAKLFPGSVLGNTLVLPDMIKKINLAQLRSFYQRTYVLPNSLLIIKGNLPRPALTAGLINRVFKSFKKQEQIAQSNQKIKINDKREVIVYHIDSLEPPEIYWFEVIPPLNHPDHFPLRVLNQMLFSYPLGKVPRNFPYLPRVSTKVVNHGQVSIICNSIKLNFRDLERFITTVDNEKRRLKKIDRKDYLDIKNYLLGRVKIDSERFEHDVEIERDRRLLVSDTGNQKAKPTPAIFQEISLTGLNKAVGDQGQGTVVIVGNAKTIVKYMQLLKPRIMRLEYKFYLTPPKNH